MPKNKEVIENIRRRVLAMNPDMFHPKDVERVKTNDWPIERYLLVNKSEDTAFAALIKTMEWRKSYGVNDFTDESFPKEVFKIGYNEIYPHKDKEGRTVLWVRFSRYHKSDLTPLLKQFVVYQFEKCDSQTSNEGWAMIADSTGSGLSNIDMDFHNFLTDLIESHYPRGLKYIAVVDLPFILNATMKLIMGFMNEELKSTVKYITKDELTQYLDPCHIPIHLKGSYDKQIAYMPSGAKPLEQIDGFTAEQIKKIRSVFKDELKA